MRAGLMLAAGWLLLRSKTAMDAAAEACRLFVTGVMPGLLPYMTVTLMLTSRLRRPLRPWQLVLMGWCGGSPCGARLLREAGECPFRRRAAAACATMSPMFLLGTLGQWLNSGRAGICLLLACLAGGVAAALTVKETPGASGSNASPEALTLGQAVEMTARTLLMVCGMMALMRVAAKLLTEALSPWPVLSLTVTTLLEVTTGAQAIAALPLPLAMRTALIAGATGFGGAALMLQNRAVLQIFSLPEQIMLQVLHGTVSFLLALGLMQL